MVSSIEERKDAMRRFFKMIAAAVAFGCVYLLVYLQSDRIGRIVRL